MDMPPSVDIRLMNLSTQLLVLCFVLLGLGAVLTWVVRHEVFDIRGITVTGDVTHNNAVTLRANVASRLSGTFLTVDLAQAREVFESAPWVRKAVVRREFPNRLQVILEEHKPVAFWGEEGASTLINGYGEVFEANVDDLEQELPRLSGPLNQAATVLAMYRALLPVFDAVDLPLTDLEMSNRGSWRVTLDTGAVIELGRGQEDEVTARTQRFLKTVTQVTSRYGRRLNALESADLRYEDGYAIRLRGVTTGTEVKKK